MKKCLVFIALVVSLVSCLDTIVPPLIITGQVTDIDTTGAIFHSKVTALGNKEVVELGFVWDENKEPTLEHGEKYIVHSPAKVGNYDEKVSYGLNKQVTYFVRAFIRSATVTTYGEQTSFVSHGSKIAEINTITPLLGNLNDTLVIAGHNFSSRSPVVKIDRQIAQVIQINQDTILVQVPPEVKSKTSVVTLENQGQMIQAKDSFKLITPVITTISPKTGTYGDEVTVTGKNFLKSPKTLAVYFDKVMAVSHVVDDKTIRVTIPKELNKSPCSITVTMNNQAVQSTDQYSLLPMTVTDFSPKTVLTGNTITITGSNFSPLPSGNIVTIGGVRTLAKTVTKNSLEVIVPLQDTAIYENRNAVVKVEVGGNVQTMTNTLLINDKWLRRDNAPVSLRNETSICSTCTPYYDYNFANSFVVNNIAYIGLNSNKELWAFDTDKNTWKKMADFPGAARMVGTGFVYEDKIYFGTGAVSLNTSTPIYLNDWWEYDTATDSWTQKATFTGGARATLKGYTTSTGCYVSNGFYWNQNIGMTVQIWKYNPVADIWGTVDIDVRSMNVTTQNWPMAKAVGDDVFIGFGNDYYGYYPNFFIFNTKTNVFTTITKFPYEIAYGIPVCMKLNNRVYVHVDGSRNFYYYERATNTWKYTETNINLDIHYGIGFEANNLGYVGLGGSNMMYEFDPNR